MKTLLLSKCFSYDFEKLFKNKGYAWFKKGAYNLNIIGIRSNNEKRITNKFDDVIVIDYNTEINHKRVCFAITTEPGKYYMKNLCNNKGAAILVPNQYRNCWELGLHKGKYRALVQKKSLSVYRDNNKDDIYDMNPQTIDNGFFGINIHRSNEFKTSEDVDMYSAGCQVFANPIDFKAFIRLCLEQSKRYGNSFTYTLLNEDDLI